MAGVVKRPTDDRDASFFGALWPTRRRKSSLQMLRDLTPVDISSSSIAVPRMSQAPLSPRYAQHLPTPSAPAARIPLLTRLSRASQGKLALGTGLDPPRRIDPAAQPASPSDRSTMPRWSRVSISRSSISRNSPEFSIIGQASVGLAASKPPPLPADVRRLKLQLLEDYRRELARKEQLLKNELDDEDIEAEKKRQERLAEENAGLAEGHADDDDDVDSAGRPLNDEELALVERHFAAAKQAPHRVVVDEHKIELTLGDIATLAPRRWLNDNVIDLYLTKVTASRPSVAVFTTHFFTRLEEGGYAAVRRWALRKKLDVLATDLVFVPVNQGNMHWTLAVVDNRHKRIEFYDSLPSGKGLREVELLKTYLEGEAKRLGRNMPNYELVPRTNAPTQSNGSDCGVFMCETVSRLARGASLRYTQADMPMLRNRIAYTLLRGGDDSSDRARL